MEDSWINSKDELEVFARSFCEYARLKPKSGKIWKLFKFSKNAVVTVGRNVYIPEYYTAEQVRKVIPHEVAGHVKQYEWCGLKIHPNVGIPIFGLLYGLIFLPVFLAWARYRLELHAETKAWEYLLREGEDSLEITYKASVFALKISSSIYLWAVPYELAYWGFIKRASKVIRKYNDSK